MVGCHHRFDGREFEQALGVGDGQEGLACCCPWGHRELDSTERLTTVHGSCPGLGSLRSPLGVAPQLLRPASRGSWAESPGQGLLSRICLHPEFPPPGAIPHPSDY